MQRPHFEVARSRTLDRRCLCAGSYSSHIPVDYGSQDKPAKNYFVWPGLMMLFVLFELIVDDILKVDFRKVQWAVVHYVMFFFSATGGMIGVAMQAGKIWTG
jgi:hypothetical protein